MTFIKPEQLPFDLNNRPAYGREDFWVSGSNRDAVAWLDNWRNWPSVALVLFGPAASGKTHLLQVWKNESNAVEILPEKITSLAADKVLGASTVVMVDNIQQMIGNEAAENALFHFYNLINERGGRLLMTADKPVAAWPVTIPDLKSRLLASPAVAVGSPDDELMAVVLSKLFSDRQIFVPQGVVEFILPRVERSFLALRDIVNRIDRKALAEKKAVTIPLVRDLISG